MRILTFIPLLFLALVHGASAGEIVLRNGAHIPGELVGFEDEHLIWNAELIGELRIVREDVATMDSSTRLNLFVAGLGRLDDCVVNKNSDDDPTIECNSQAPNRIAMASLSAAAPDWESSGSLLADINLQRNNTDKDEYDIDGKASWRRYSRRNNLSIEIDRELRDKTVIEDQLLLNYQMDFLRDQGWYRYAKATIETDDFSAARRTAFIGGGIGRERNFGNGLTARLQGGLDVAWGEMRDTDCDQTSGTASCSKFESRSQFATNTQWQINWAIAWREVVVFNEGEWKMGIGEGNEWRVDTNTGLRIPLRFGVVADLSVEYDAVSTPLDTSADRENVEWKLRFGYQW